MIIRALQRRQVIRSAFLLLGTLCCIVSEATTTPARRLPISEEAGGSNSTSKTNETVINRVRYKLPQVEVQFLCANDIRPDFNVTDTFASFYRDFLNENYNKIQQYMKPSTHQNNSSDSTVVVKDDMDLYSALSINSVSDVSSTRWYYPLCNQSSNEILATMDVRGYIFVSQVQLSEDEDEQHSSREEFLLPALVGELFEDIDQKILRRYFEGHVCQGIDFFRTKIMAYNDVSYPPPSNHQRIKEYERPQQYSNTGNPRYNHHHFLDHNLYLLCGGAEDTYYQENGEGPDGGFLVLGILVGMVMISMICTELQQFGVSSSRRRLLAGRNGFDDYAVPPQEVEMV